ncbi:MAG: hypothetical protein LAO55_06950 [Acidobacteriia bacterium]|nr:hypothetical protein [Terriglobia bacterium]
MIDHTLVLSPTAALVFHLKQAFFMYAWPMMIGFLTILGYQVLGRIGMAGSVKWPVVFVLGSVVSMISLLGWAMMVRSLSMIPFYGCGVGVASAMMSRVYAVTMPIHPRLKVRIPRVTWRGDKKGIEQLQQALKARAAAARPGAAGV